VVVELGESVGALVVSFSQNSAPAPQWPKDEQQGAFEGQS